MARPSPPSPPAAASQPLNAPPPSRSPWQVLYGLCHGLRRRWYARRARRLPRPVISVGNLHWGGSGKTPLVIAIASHLKQHGLEVAVLSRGYGRHDSAVRVVSRGEGPLLGPRLAGDEPVLLAGALPGVSVVVGPDRYRAGRHALERLDPPPDIFVLDDGFSHLRLARDLDLLAFPNADPFARGRLAPAGRLREPLASAAHADAVLLTGRGLAVDGGDRLARALRSYGFAGPGFNAPTQIGEPRSVPPAEEVSPGARALAVSAIARPDEFHHTARELGFDIVERLTFPDHHRYPPASLDKIRHSYRQSGAELILATSKDRVKLQGRLDEPLVEIPVRAEPEADFFRWLDLRLRDMTEKRDGA